MTARRRRPCGVPWFPHGLQWARPYVCGWRCDRHAPWALAGRPEPLPGPGWPAGAWTTPSPQSASAVIASGKRRASSHEYRAAQAAVAAERSRARPAARPALVVDLGDWSTTARQWLRYPTADYRCPDCGWTDAASGDAVARFAARIETEHRAVCPAHTPDPS